MPYEDFIKKINLFHQCRNYGIPLWQCPSFLFLIMSIIIIFSSLFTWLIGVRFIEPHYVALIVLFLTAFLFFITFVITQSFEKLVETNKIKSDFINIISHEIRSPLSNLKWILELLMLGAKEGSKTKQAEYLNLLKENTDRMTELVSDLLMVYRIETSTLIQKKVEVSLYEIIQKEIANFQKISQNLKIEIIFKAENNIPKVFIDSEQIKRAIRNLLDNAVRYIQNKGKIEIFLGLKNGNIYFEIKDNGVGIPKSDQKYVFQKFFRSGNILKNQTSGFGLGLYIVKSVIEKSGGKIGFKSEENKGSTFWFVLPIKNSL